MNPVIPVIAQRSMPGLRRAISRQGLSLKKNSPHILFVAGLGGMVTSTVLACKATLKLPETMDEIERDLDVAKELKQGKLDGVGNYPDEEVTRDVAYVYIRSGIRLARLYGPAAGIGLVSVSSLIGSHVQLTRRNKALMAAYASLSAAFSEYKRRVMEELGEDKERELSQPMKEVDGKKVPDATNKAALARIFDEASREFQKDAEYNRLFLQCQQNILNEILHAKGYVFLNDAYEALGFEKTPDGQLLGWVVGGDGDGYIDFGFNNVSDFITGREPRVWLNFNVDGVIYDLI